MAHKLMFSTHPNIAIVNIFSVFSRFDLELENELGLHSSTPTFLLLDLSEVSPILSFETLNAILHCCLNHKQIAHLAVHTSTGANSPLVDAIDRLFVREPHRLSVHISYQSAFLRLVAYAEGRIPLHEAPATLRAV
jgi:hypothetical protein